MARGVKPIRFQTRAVALIVLTLTALACLVSFAHAGMGMASEQDCFGPACPQQITCARADQAPAPPSRPLAGSLAAVGSAAIVIAMPRSRMPAPAPSPAAPSRRSASPFAPRSPPAA